MLSLIPQCIRVLHSVSLRMLAVPFLLIGLIFVIEAGSSAIQIFSKKVFKRKIFISAPIHHHLEATGWEETKITMRFWIIGMVMAFIGVILALAEHKIL